MSASILARITQRQGNAMSKSQISREQLANKVLAALLAVASVAARDRLSSFDARVLDLQVVIEAYTERELERAGRELAAIV